MAHRKKGLAISLDPPRSKSLPERVDDEVLASGGRSVQVIVFWTEKVQPSFTATREAVAKKYAAGWVTDMVNRDGIDYLILKPR